MNNQCFRLIVTIYLNDFFAKNSASMFPFARAQLGTNDKEARSYFQNGDEAQLLGRVAPSDHNQWIASLTKARECLAIHLKTPDQSWSWREFWRHWRPSMTDSFQIWLIWGQKWAAEEHNTYVRHLDREMRVRGTWCHWFSWYTLSKTLACIILSLLALQFRIRVKPHLLGFTTSVKCCIWTHSEWHLFNSIIAWKEIHPI